MTKQPLDTNEMIEATDDFETAYTAHADRIYRFLFWRTRDSQLSEDLTSSVFEKAWRARVSFQGGSVQAWLYRIARNVLTDHWRKKKEVAVEDIDKFADERASADQAFGATIQLEQLQAALAKLPSDQQHVINLRFIEGQSAKVVAAHLHVSEGNVRIMQYRALKRLRKYLS
jgi:RNA polymerase sigma-70 factor (ECF subfamily)